MNFVEAAIALLAEADGPIHVTELCDKAVERGLLDRPGKTPLRSMKGRLTTELKKGDASRVVKVGDDTWALRDAAAEAPASAEEPEAAEPEQTEPQQTEPEEELSDEEKALVEIYGDEQSATSMADIAEYRDERTDDEDRALLPEIKAERRGRPRRDRERERGRRSRRDRDRDRDRDRKRGRRQVEPEGDTLADRAYAALASAKNSRAINVNELAQNMKSRDLLAGDPSDFAPLIKAALIADTAQRLQAGYRPRAVYRGKGLFAPAAKLDDAERDADRALAEAASRVDDATRDALAKRLQSASQVALERIGYLYLEAYGWRDVEWIKRVGPASYATARNAESNEIWLISVRGGKGPVDRRGVGELRAGVKAKDLPGGLLISPHELGDEARAELCRGGKLLSIACGREWLAALIAAGVGVVAADVRVYYLDSELLDAL